MFKTTRAHLLRVSISSKKIAVKAILYDQEYAQSSLLHLDLKRNGIFGFNTSIVEAGFSVQTIGSFEEFVKSGQGTENLALITKFSHGGVSCFICIQGLLYSEK